jgi:hypothetical protein
VRSLPLSIAAACALWAVTLIAHEGSAPLSAPRLLSETGLFAAGTTAIDPRNRPFSPQYPLWSDGAGKSRWIYLPPGATIDASDVDDWDFPVGTRLWKEFAFSGRKVETRMLWKSAAHAWTFASYMWNDAQTDAALAPDEGVKDVAEAAPGKRHSIPSIADCHACHESARIQILGFTALQLSTDRDPGALHAEPPSANGVTLHTLVDERLLRGAPTDLLTVPPRIRAESATTRSVLGYLSANCGACHTLNGPLASLGLDFRQKTRGPLWTDAAVSALLHRTTTWQRPGAGEGETRVMVAGSPDLSALLYRMRSRRPSSQMPPLGTVVPDSEAVARVTQWIAGLHAEAPQAPTVHTN